MKMYEIPYLDFPSISEVLIVIIINLEVKTLYKKLLFLLMSINSDVLIFTQG